MKGSSGKTLSKIIDTKNYYKEHQKLVRPRLEVEAPVSHLHPLKELETCGDAGAPLRTRVNQSAARARAPRH